MFCGECGAKLKKGDLFCGECGAKTGQTEEVKKVVKKESTNTSPSPKKPMDKKTKIIIAVVAVVAVGLFGLYQMFSNMYSPKEVAKDYIDALVSKDASKLYSYIELEGDKTFVTKNAFKTLLEDEDYSVNIDNYVITDVEYTSGKLSAKVTVSYTTKSSSSEKTKTISLTKAKNKKLLFFDNWQVADMSTDSMVVEDYEITVPKNSKVTYSGIKVDKKFLDKDESTENEDVYLLPQVFKAKTKIKVELSNGMKITDEKTPSSYYNSYKLSLSLDKLSDADKKSLTKTFKSDVEALYKNGIEKKTWDDVKTTYSKNNIDTDDLEDSYKDFFENLTDSSNVLKSINFTDVELSNLSLDSDGNLVVRAKTKYKYSIEYTSFNGETTTNDDNDSNYMTLVYKMTGKTYSLYEIKSITTYFSRY